MGLFEEKADAWEVIAKLGSLWFVFDGGEIGGMCDLFAQDTALFLLDGRGFGLGYALGDRLARRSRFNGSGGSFAQTNRRKLSGGGFKEAAGEHRGIAERSRTGLGGGGQSGSFAQDRGTESIGAGSPRVFGLDTLGGFGSGAFVEVFDRFIASTKERFTQGGEESACAVLNGGDEGVDAFTDGRLNAGDVSLAGGGSGRFGSAFSWGFLDAGFLLGLADLALADLALADLALGFIGVSGFGIRFGGGGGVVFFAFGFLALLDDFLAEIVTNTCGDVAELGGDFL